MRKHNEVDGYAGPEIPLTSNWLLERGGTCYMGFPNYRCVHTSKLTMLSGGEWCDWDKSIPAEERGSLVMGLYGQVVPDSRAQKQVAEMRRVEKYAEFYHTPGWVLEKWMRPLYFGAREEWEERKVPGTQIPMLGPYPHQGGYILIGGPYPQGPTGPFLEQLIEHWEAMRDEVLAYEAGSYVRKRVFEAEERHAQREERWNRDASAANLACMAPLFSTALEAGRARQLAVEHSGITSHYGN